MLGARCEDCGLEYPFPDYVLPNDLWKRIAPKSDGNGLLCPTCIAKRLDAIDIWYQDGYYKPVGWSVFNPLQETVDQLREELEAVKQDLRKDCTTCEHKGKSGLSEPCLNCQGCEYASWKWRG